MLLLQPLILKKIIDRISYLIDERDKQQIHQHRLNHQIKDKNISSVHKIRKDNNLEHDFSSFGKKKQRNSLYNTSETMVG